jgi:hypothetical protein
LIEIDELPVVIILVPQAGKIGGNQRREFGGELALSAHLPIGRSTNKTRRFLNCSKGKTNLYHRRRDVLILFGVDPLFPQDWK